MSWGKGWGKSWGKSWGYSYTAFTYYPASFYVVYKNVSTFNSVPTIYIPTNNISHYIYTKPKNVTPTSN